MNVLFALNQSTVLAVVLTVIVVLMCSKFFKVLKESVGAAGVKLSFNGALKQVYIVRTDLEMGKGKVAAQCCHAAVKAFMDLSSRGEESVKALNRWEWEGSRKVVLKIGSEKEMVDLIQNAKRKGIYATTIRDAGKTQIPSGSLTVGVIGPAGEKDIDAVSGHLKLL